jgi:hypothetical protein
MTEKKREVATPWRAGCLERGMSGCVSSEGWRVQQEGNLPE